ncbi:hypothetical protein [Amycolatopsis sp. cmx-4-61]|uniref:hypothetical protein n=1 Tax=Amycolatopsis sp. cmx-4-61 TaxID=2790937 RepID=UPI00397A1042
MFDGVEEQDVVGSPAVFGHAGHHSGQLRVTLVRPGAPGEGTGTFKRKFAVPASWNPDGTDLLVVPGGGYGAKNGPGVNTVIKGKEVLQDLVRSHQAGVVLAGVCTGVMVVSAAGLPRDAPARPTTLRRPTSLLSRLR